MSFGERWLLLPFPLLDLFAVKCVHWPILYRVVSLVLRLPSKPVDFVLTLSQCQVAHHLHILSNFLQLSNILILVSPTPVSQYYSLAQLSPSWFTGLGSVHYEPDVELRYSFSVSIAECFLIYSLNDKVSQGFLTGSVIIFCLHSLLI